MGLIGVRKFMPYTLYTLLVLLLLSRQFLSLFVHLNVYKIAQQKNRIKVQNKHILRWCMHFKSHSVMSGEWQYKFWNGTSYHLWRSIVSTVSIALSSQILWYINVLINIGNIMPPPPPPLKHCDENAEKLLCIYAITFIMLTWHYYQPTYYLAKVAGCV